MYPLGKASHFFRAKIPPLSADSSINHIYFGMSIFLLWTQGFHLHGFATFLKIAVKILKLISSAQSVHRRCLCLLRKCHKLAIPRVVSYRESNMYQGRYETIELWRYAGLTQTLLLINNLYMSGAGGYWVISIMNKHFIPASLESGLELLFIYLSGA